MSEKDPKIDPAQATSQEVVIEDESATPAPAPSNDTAIDEFGFGPKKKKGKKKGTDSTDAAAAADPSAVVDGATPAAPAVPVEKDYTYDDLLKRAFEIMRERNPELDALGASKYVLKPPELSRVGTKKTSFVNFADICRQLHRQQKHVQNFIQAELGTTGSLDGNSQLIVKGRFQIKQFENVLRNYIKEYVLCHTCKSANTNLVKDSRLVFLQCDKCGSRCSVASIKSGFQALTGKRSALRAKTG